MFWIENGVICLHHIISISDRILHGWRCLVQYIWMKGMSLLHSRRKYQKYKVKVSIRKDKRIGWAWTQVNRKKEVQKTSSENEGLWRKGENTSINSRKFHTLLMFNKSISYIWIFYYSMTVINPLINRKRGGIEPIFLYHLTPEWRLAQYNITKFTQSCSSLIMVWYVFWA